MRKFATALSLAVLLIAGLAAAPSVYAEQEASGSSMGQGMGNGMMDGRDMMGMMKMMKQMGRMMDHCGGMMNDGGNRPNDQWRKKAPSEPEQ